MSDLPKRVLDLGTSNDPYVRLYESQGEAEQYVCLSHFWGGQSLLQTTIANLSSHKVQIPWNGLSLTYQETIDFVRKLGIRYLWIDSLCIIQDDEVDWREEAAKMAAIYRGAYLTICATVSANTDGGLFAVASPEFKSHRLTYFDTHGRPQEVYARLKLAHAFFQGVMNVAINNKLSIYKRGWILQERLLSRRVLHFTPQELNWECMTETVCECSGTISVVVEGPKTHHTIVDMAELGTSPKRFYSFARLSSIDSTWVERRWRKLVEEYTALELTYEKDIFPAISGLAKEFDRARPSTYLAGLWKSSFLCDMLWYACYTSFNSDSSPPKRPAAWRAPTWSWASVRYEVSFAVGTESHSSCELLNVECSCVGTDPMGQVTEGHVVLRGTVSPTTLNYTPQPNSACPYFHGKNYNIGFLRQHLGQPTYYPDYNYWEQGPQQIKPGTPVSLLRVGTGTSNNQTTAYHLMLKPVGYDDDNACTVYERIGLVIDYYAMSMEIEEEAVIKII